MRAGTLDVARVIGGARIVVLGGTGFLGKLFWSMLLDRYPSVGRIYLVVRPKDADKEAESGTPESRFANEIATSEALEPLRRAHGVAYEAFLKEKVVPVDGDMGRTLCGLDEALVAQLAGTIDAVVNVAGVVDFNPPLDDALDANAFGAQNLVSLARALGDAPVFHTSTCYVAGNRKGLILEEDPRRVPFPLVGTIDVESWDPDREIAECLDLIAQAEHRSEDAFRRTEFSERARKNLIALGEPIQGEAYERELASVKRAFVRERIVEAGLDRATHWGWPNIYTYTKAIGEQVVAGSGLPFTIARPAACESTLAFPEPAFNEGINTSAPLIYLIMKGEPQILGAHVPLDLIPADHVVAGMVLALAELLEGTSKPVYQLGAADVNPCTVQRFGELVGLYKRSHYRKKGTGSLLFDALQARYEPTFVDRAKFERTGAPARAAVGKGIASFIRKSIPPLAPAADMLDRVARRDAKIADIQRLFEPFTSNVIGPFDCSNTRAAYARLSEEDKQKLPWAPESIDWADWMMKIHMPAMERRIIPEMDRRLKKAVRPLRPHATLVSMLDEAAELHGTATALQRSTDEGLTRTSFSDIRRGAIAVSARLAAHRIGKGDRVAISGRNDPDWVIAYFGIVRAGAIAIPVDPGLDETAWHSVIEESGARAVVWDDTVKCKQRVAGTHPTVVQLDLRTAVELPDVLQAPRTRVDPTDVASVIFTSGTTGRPKGVMLTHGNFTSLVAALTPIFPLGARDVVLSVLPLHHTFEFTCGLLLPLSRGARVVYVGEVSAERIADGLRASRPTAMVGVPAIWQLIERRIMQRVDAHGPLARVAFDAALEANRFLTDKLGVEAGALLFGKVHAELGGKVRLLISGGAALPRETQERFAGLGLELTQGYGLTEAAPVLAVARPGSRSRAGVGKAVPGVQLRIDNPDRSGVGEIVARGPNVMAGYTDPQATADAIDDAGWLHTGDLGHLDAHGNLQIVGRIKNVVISPNGENVYPEDVEQRLGPVSHVAELAVVGVELRGAERLACLAVAAEDDALGRAERTDRARQALRRAIDALPHGQRPSILHVVDLPLPRTATRKIKRDEVRATLVRLMEAGSLTDGGNAIADPVRAAIAGVARIRLEEVRPTASLQGELGLDSLAMAQLLELLEARFGAIEGARLQACATVDDVERLVTALDASPSPPPATSAKPPQDESRLLLAEPARTIGKALVGKAQDLFYGGVMRPRVYGRAYIPYNRSVIVVANHASHLDMGLVRHALGAYGRGIVSLAAQDYFFERGTIKRAFFENLTNLQPIDRHASLRQSIRQATEVMEQGKTVLIFPEGTRSPTGEMGEFKPLVGHLALAQRVDILPIFLSGTHAALPKGAAFPTQRDLVARIGPVLCVGDLERLTHGLSPAHASREVARLAQAAVSALRDGHVLDLRGALRGDAVAAERENPLVTLFSELESKFRAGEVEHPVSYYVTLGSEELAKWTVRVD
ncbi:MAG TPA: AMP-binding protein, partial [Polyangiaceae bacterium]|nr:AMP-binding protein [Polyangiaceae bacterium]